MRNNNSNTLSWTCTCTYIVRHSMKDLRQAASKTQPWPTLPNRYYEDLQCKAVDEVIERRLAAGEPVNLPSGKLLERLLTLKMIRDGIAGQPSAPTDKACFLPRLIQLSEPRLTSIKWVHVLESFLAYTSHLWLLALGFLCVFVISVSNTLGHTSGRTSPKTSGTLL